MAKLLDLTGKRFGMLKVITRGKDRVNPCGRTNVTWLCICDCGKRKEILSNSLIGKRTQSCGCMQKAAVTRHGDNSSNKSTRLYKVWADMLSRCRNKNTKYYHRYGGRGITVCKEWLDYLVFKEWALANGYKGNLTIDRRNNDGNYEPSNCRFITIQEQQWNKSANRKVVSA